MKPARQLTEPAQCLREPAKPVKPARLLTEPAQCLREPAKPARQLTEHAHDLTEPARDSREPVEPAKPVLSKNSSHYLKFPSARSEQKEGACPTYDRPAYLMAKPYRDCALV